MRSAAFHHDGRNARIGIVRRKDRKGHMITAAVKLSEKLERKEPRAPI